MYIVTRDGHELKKAAQVFSWRGMGEDEHVLNGQGLKDFCFFGTFLE
jgi:hypothetical protein